MLLFPSSHKCCPAAAFVRVQPLQQLAGRRSRWRRGRPALASRGTASPEGVTHAGLQGNVCLLQLQLWAPAGPPLPHAPRACRTVMNRLPWKARVRARGRLSSRRAASSPSPPSMVAACACPRPATAPRAPNNSDLSSPSGGRSQQLTPFQLPEAPARPPPWAAPQALCSGCHATLSLCTSFLQGSVWQSGHLGSRDGSICRACIAPARLLSL